MQFSLLQIATLATAAPLAPATAETADVVVAEVVVAAPAMPEDEAEPVAETAPAPEGDVIFVTGVHVETPGDPLENLNATTFELVQGVDRMLVEPVAEAYEDTVPDPLRAGLRNFLQNLLEPVNFVNGLLQFKPDLAFAALGRFAINSSLGLGGVFDVAKNDPIGLEFRRNGFANTLGYYGVGEGAYLVVPLIGATTVRDLVGNTLDQAMVPFLVGPPLNTTYYAVPAYTINSIEFRNRFDDRITAINAADDPYAAARESYLCQRRADIADLHGDPVPDCRLEVLLAEEAEPDEEAAQ
jgi:phospholipid-binding lipoprotein MlaA